MRPSGLGEILCRDIWTPVFLTSSDKYGVSIPQISNWICALVLIFILIKMCLIRKHHRRLLSGNRHFILSLLLYIFSFVFFFKTTHNIKHQALCEWLYRLAAAKINEHSFSTVQTRQSHTVNQFLCTISGIYHYGIQSTVDLVWRWNKYLAQTAFDKPVVITDWLQQTCFWYTESTHTISGSSSTHSCDTFGQQQLQLIYYSTCLRTWHK